MILSNVNIGTGPSSGDGDPLRSAFATINTNFQTITNNVNALSNSVTSVAGRTGNITLTVNDVIGAASVAYVNSQLGNAGSYSNINVTAFLPSYTGNIATVTAANLAMKGYVDSSIAALVDSAPGTLDTLNELAAALGDDPNLSVTLTNTINSANTNMKAYVDGQISAVNVSVSSANVGLKGYVDQVNVGLKGYVDSQISTVSDSVTAANVGLKGYVDQANTIQATAINDANLGMKGYVDSVAGQGSYANANVAAYLLSYAGNIAINTIIFDDLSEQRTAYTGTQWRSNLTSNVTVKPSWMSYYPGLKNQLGTQYGFDSNGMFFSGNADNDIGYPIRTNLHIHGEDATEIIATINFANTNDDHGIAIFNSTAIPVWRYGTDTTRIAFQFSSGTPRLYGQTTQDVSGTPVVTAGNDYTIKFVYSPGNTVTVYTYDGPDTSGTLLDTRTINEVLPAGDYIIGFDADQDTVGNKSYFTNIIIRTLTNTVVNEFEIQGQVTGNLIPSANVTYSLGNITHQWKELWVGNSTIYIGGVPISVDAGANLLVNGTALPTFSAGNVFALPGGDVTLEPDEGFLTINTLYGGEMAMDDGAGNVGSIGIETGESAFITIDNGSGAKLWRFDVDGNLTLPGRIIGYDPVMGYERVSLQPSPEVSENFLFYVDQTTGTFNRAGMEFPIGDADKAVTLAFPHSNTTTGYIYNQGTDTSGTELNNALNIMMNSGNIKITALSPGPTYNTWAFNNDATLTFPDSTVQTTAWTGAVTAIANGTSNVKIDASNGNINFNVNGFNYGTIAATGGVSLGYHQYPISGNSSVIAIGTDSGLTGQGDYAIALGRTAGWAFQGQYTVAIGFDAGKTAQVDNSIAIGRGAGSSAQSGNAVAIGYRAGGATQGAQAVAIGQDAGNTSQGASTVAIGTTAGQSSQGIKAIGIGEVAGRLNQGVESVAIGAGAGEQNQGAYSVAIGSVAAYYNQGIGAVAIGVSAGAINQGLNAVAIGTNAGAGLQGNNSIIINATGNTLDQTTANTFTVAPIRNTTSSSGVLQYNNSTSEITYSTTVTLNTITATSVSSNTINGNVDIVIGNVANVSATKTRIVSDSAYSYIQTGNGTPGSTGNIVFSPYLSPTQQVVIDTSSGSITAGNITVAGIVKTGVFTVASLPSAGAVGAGARAFVSDADAVTFGNLAVGGGPYYLPVFSNGTNWYLG